MLVLFFMAIVCITTATQCSEESDLARALRESAEYQRVIEASKLTAQPKKPAAPKQPAAPVRQPGAGAAPKRPATQGEKKQVQETDEARELRESREFEEAVQASKRTTQPAPKRPATQAESKETLAHPEAQAFAEKLRKKRAEERAAQAAGSAAGGSGAAPKQPSAPARVGAGAGAGAGQEERKKERAAFAIEKVEIIPIKVARQEGGDCGFHGIKNGVILLKWATERMSEAQRNKELMTGASTIETLRKCSAGVTVVDDFALNEIVRNMKMDVDKDRFVVIANVNEAQRNLTSAQPEFEGFAYPGIGKALQDLQNNEKAAYVFVLGNAKTVGGQAQAGHYITVLALKNKNTLELYLTDSFTEAFYEKPGQKMNAEAKKMADALANIIRTAKNPKALTALFGAND